MIIKWVGCSPSNYSVGRGGNTISKIVIHWIVGSQASCDATFADGRRLASAHYSVGQSEIHQYVKEEDTAWHAGNFSINQQSIGIEHEGGPDLPITEAVYNQSVELVADICKRYNIPCDRDHIRKHKEVSDKITECCGTFDIDRVVREAKLKMEPVVVNPDQVKVNIGGDWGTMEVQAIRSKLNDLVRDLTSAKEQNKILDGFISKWVQEWNLAPTDGLVAIEVEMAKLLPLEDRFAEYRTAIEEAVGVYDDDYALLIALKAVKAQFKANADMIVELQGKLDAAKVPAGYKFWKSWSLFNGKYLVKMYRKEVS